MFLRIKELLDSPVEFSSFKSLGVFTYSFFAIEKEEYIVIFHKDSPSEFKGVLQQNNVVYSSPLSKLSIDIYSFFFGLITPEMRGKSIQHILTPEGIQDTTTNTGNTIKVFSTVANIAKKFIELKNPSLFYYGAKEETRFNLYRILGKKLLDAFPNKYTMFEDKGFCIFNKK